MHGQPTVTIRGPEIHYLKQQKNYFIILSMAPSGIALLKSKTGKPEDPCVDCGPESKPLRGGLDPTLFEDNDGKIYIAANGAGASAA